VKLRCSGTTHAHLDGEVLEVKCDSRICGAERGVVVLHRFSTATGQLLETKKFSDPLDRRDPDASGNCVSVRSA
jgi:hypothetical protein